MELCLSSFSRRGTLLPPSAAAVSSKLTPAAAGQNNKRQSLVKTNDSLSQMISRRSRHRQQHNRSIDCYSEDDDSSNSPSSSSSELNVDSPRAPGRRLVPDDGGGDTTTTVVKPRGPDSPHQPGRGLGGAQRRSSPHSRSFAALMVAQLEKSCGGVLAAVAVGGGVPPRVRAQSIQSLSCTSLEERGCGSSSSGSSSLRAFLTVPSQHQLKRHSLV